MASSELIATDEEIEARAEQVAQFYITLLRMRIPTPPPTWGRARDAFERLTGRPCPTKKWMGDYPNPLED